MTTNRIINQHDNMKMVKQGQFVLPRRGGAGAVGGGPGLGGDAGVLQPGCTLLRAEAEGGHCGV